MADSMLTVDAARDQLIRSARPPTGRETVAATDALGRVLAEPLLADLAVPPFANAAMDGYALRLADWSADGWLAVRQRIVAGQVGRPLGAGEAARIFTGAPIPAGADCVAMQEDCDTRQTDMGEGASGPEVRVRRAPRPGEHVRPAGEDIAPGQTALAAGARLGPAQLGLTAALGRTELMVYPRLRVALLYTGDEIVLPGQPLGPGQIYNSNRAMLAALTAGLGCAVTDLGQVPDRLDATVALLDAASRQADVVITSGGVSVGEEDHVRAALQRLGQVELWKVAMKPGKPLLYGRIDGTDLIGLPGNPVSAFVVFALFVRPFLLARMGASPEPLPGYTLPAGFDWTRPGKRREFLRARVEAGRVVLHSKQGSGALSSLAWAQGLADLPADTVIHAGDPINYMPLAELMQ